MAAIRSMTCWNKVNWQRNGWRSFCCIERYREGMQTQTWTTERLVCIPKQVELEMNQSGI